MENINDISNKQFKELSMELSKMSYIEGVSMIYERFRVIRGIEKRQIGKKQYTISVTPNTANENLQRWEYYLEQKSNEFILEWKDLNLKNIDKTPDKITAISKHIENIKEIILSNKDIKNGYNYAITRAGLEWVNSGHLSFDFQSILCNWAKGLGCYFIEQELITLKDSTTEGSIIDFLDLEQLDHKQKLVLVHELGIISYIEQKFDLGSDRVRVARILALMFGINNKTETFLKFYDSVRKLYAKDVTKGPLNKKNLDLINGQLTLIGVQLNNKPHTKK
jgi:hypothetical protein